MKQLILAAAVSATLISGCSSSDDNNDTASMMIEDTALLQGLQTGEAVGSVPESIGALEAALNTNEAISIVAQIDHQANAAANGLELRPTSVTLFGNPNLGTPLMQINQLAGIDLPQKILAWEDETGQTNIAYNSADYLSGRHGVEAAEAQLTTIAGALANFSSIAAGQEFVPAEVTAPALGEGIVVVESANDMDTTANILRDAIVSAAPLTLVAEVDHSANAANVGLELGPTLLFIFGNPNLGTPLMQTEQSIGIDLPQKMLVFEDSDGTVSVAYNDPAFLAARHGITGQDDILATITTALGNLSTGATTAQ